MRAVSSFSDGDFRAFGMLNEALVTLIPKNEGAEVLRDYRP